MKSLHRWMLGLLLLCTSFPLSASVQNILILKGGNLEPFQQAIAGFRKGLQEGRIPCKISEHDLSEGTKQIVEQAKTVSPDLIVAVGSDAVQFSKQQFPDTPTVFSMVLYPSLIGAGPMPSSYMTGISLDIPLAVQFKTILRVVPAAKKIGVLYNPKETGTIIQQAKETSNQLQLQLIALPVDSPKDVPAALEGAEKKVDVLWSVADSTVFSGKMPEYILQYTLQHDLPFMGLSQSFLEAGALFALCQDYTDMGLQTADLAIRLLAGAKPVEIPVAVPRKMSLWLNLRAAKEIGLTIQPEVAKSAAKVIQ